MNRRLGAASTARDGLALARQPRAVWVCGAAASGKSRIAAGAILPLGCEFIDVDAWYEEISRQHGLDLDRVEPAEEDAERMGAARRDRRRAERLFEQMSVGGWTDPLAFAATLLAAGEEGEIDVRAARTLAAEVRARVGDDPVPAEEVRQILWPRMADWADPREALAAGRTVTPGLALAVARELAKRASAAVRAARRDLLFVETGGQAGKILKLREALAGEGYRTLLVWVEAGGNEIAQRRAATRQAAGGRGLDPAIVEHTCEIAARSRPRLATAFHPDVIEVDNREEGDESLGAIIAETARQVAAWWEVP